MTVAIIIIHARFNIHSIVDNMFDIRYKIQGVTTFVFY